LVIGHTDGGHSEQEAEGPGDSGSWVRFVTPFRTAWWRKSVRSGMAR
jgi:hypothetical protein